MNLSAEAADDVSGGDMLAFIILVSDSFLSCVLEWSPESTIRASIRRVEIIFFSLLCFS